MTRVEAAWAHLENAGRFERAAQMVLDADPSSMLVQAQYGAAQHETGLARLAVDLAIEVERDGDVDAELGLLREMSR